MWLCEVRQILILSTSLPIPGSESFRGLERSSCKGTEGRGNQELLYVILDLSWVCEAILDFIIIVGIHFFVLENTKPYVRTSVPRPGRRSRVNWRKNSGCSLVGTPLVHSHLPLDVLFQELLSHSASLLSGQKSKTQSKGSRGKQRPAGSFELWIPRHYYFLTTPWWHQPTLLIRTDRSRCMPFEQWGTYSGA